MKEKSLSCRIIIEKLYPQELISAIIPENNINGKENSSKIETYIGIQTKFELKGFNRIQTLRLTINDLLEHLDFAHKTWVRIQKLK
ncbi:MAG: hypothetical protein ACXAC7_11075 [Candidatus Hodarchaeales archaeon]|jgi:hypothetical protein